MGASDRFGDSLEDFELFLARLFDLHNRSQIVASVAIIRGTPHSH